MPELTNEIAAQLVRESIYLANENVGPGPKQARFVVVMAVPYGEADGCQSMREAVEAFQQLISDDDWEERTFQVFDAVTGKIEQYVPESEARCVDCDEPYDHNGDGYVNGRCPACADAVERNMESNEPRYECQNCGRMHTEEELRPLQHAEQRVSPGEPMPAGECCECGCACREVTEGDDNAEV
jgi:hypothetical protein